MQNAITGTFAYENLSSHFFKLLTFKQMCNLVSKTLLGELSLKITILTFMKQVY